MGKYSLTVLSPLHLQVSCSPLELPECSLLLSIGYGPRFLTVKHPATSTAPKSTTWSSFHCPSTSIHPILAFCGLFCAPSNLRRQDPHLYMSSYRSRTTDHFFAFFRTLWITFSGPLPGRDGVPPVTLPFPFIFGATLSPAKITPHHLAPITIATHLTHQHSCKSAHSSFLHKYFFPPLISATLLLPVAFLSLLLPGAS